MRTPPIPRSLLPDSMEVRLPADSEWGGEHEDAARSVGHVRFEDAATLSAGEYSLSDGSRGLVFVDRANSEGAFEVPVNSLVSINGGPEMAVVGCTPCKEFGEVHHWEVEVR